MKKIMGILGALALAALATVTVAMGPAAATPDLTLGTCNPGWYVNPGETDRKPTPGPTGVKFEGNDLIHHGVTGSIEGLAAGTFTASPAPDQLSFFSVEVRNGNGTGYATLRWNTSTSKWEMTTGGTFYENASAAELVKMPEPDRSSFLVSFGVGYTNSPPGTVATVATVVSAISFKGVSYDMKCVPPASSSSSSASASASSSSKPPSASASATASQSASTSSTPSASTSSAPVLTPGSSAGLPLTGTPVVLLASIGGSLLLAGAALVLWLWWRNRTEFTVED
jgi:hypothetical protein